MFTKKRERERERERVEKKLARFWPDFGQI
jgi:hypothetical protein